MKNTLTALSVSVLLVACGGSGSDSGGGQSTPTLGSAFGEQFIDTRSLEVDESFGFETARTVLVEFDIEAAHSDDANVSICTDYEPVGEEFDVNFDSCTVQGTLDNGVFNHSMEITNDKESVVGVVLFQDAALQPMYKEFFVDDSQRTRSDGSTERVIVWQ